ncbi:DUF4397 domain-containing protein [Sutcliffiella rhizosphaerae]|uniref:DUF4397 domain-containing protein n=1 Tax=Sutcliffiella rhizosphaerae TaxID=2880967 RepID=A0ABM8YMZ3_9BACI|nr:DUF4397 domain-containing protein [Sutcliffiella rhizosphaerae]CAG9621340.1 hypothetical protein BACCIP111883_02112 [Sutcliffiella rhizosphaerae]
MKKLVSVSLVFLFLFSCLNNAYAAPQEAKVRILHASPDAQAVDVYIDNKAVVSGAKFKDATKYLPIASGAHKLEIFPAGTKDKAIISRELSLDGGKFYTLAAVNKLNSLELIAVEDTTKAPKGKTLVRLGHLSPDAPKVDVRIKKENKLFTGVAFKDITVYQQLKPGKYALEITTTDGKKILDLPRKKFDKNTVYSIFVVNNANKPEVLLLVDSK